MKKWLLILISVLVIFIVLLAITGKIFGVINIPKVTIT